MITYSPYDILNIESVNNQKQLKKQYKQLIRRFTPEHAPKEFMEIRNAYDSLVGNQEENINIELEYPETFPMYKSINTYFENKQSEELNQDKVIHTLTSIFETPFDTHKEVLEALEGDKPNF